jgi:hypothetical protein
MVYVASDDDSLANLDLGLSEGRWAFPPGVESRDLDRLELGDLVFFGWGGGMRTGGKLAGWQSRQLTEAHVTRVVRLPFENHVPFWLDEQRHTTLRYNPTIEIELLRSFDHVPLAAGRGLSLEATDALYRGGVSHKAMRVSTAGSPFLEVEDLPASVLRPPRIGRRAADQGRAERRARVRMVAIESERLQRARRRAQPETYVIPAESPLVHDYRRHLRAQGEDLVSLLIDTTSGEQIRSDGFCPTRELLIEAKSTVTRNAIRNAIGQLFDYGRFRQLEGRAVLVPERPDSDLLELLTVAGIDAIWRDRRSFADTRDGLYC